jgi:hypothetical protein
MSKPTAYYLPLGDGFYRPTAATESPWDRTAEHGGPPTALLGHAMCMLEPDPGFRLGRITVEFLGVLPRSDVRVEARVARPGRRIRMLEADMYAGERQIALARAWQIAVQDGMADVPAAAPDEPASLPAEQPQEYFTELAGWGYGESIEWRWEAGSYTVPGPATVWTRVRLPLVAGEPLRPLERALVVADSANGVSAILPLDRWLFVPPGISVTLHRYPQGEWVRMAAETTLAPDGLGSTLGLLADQAGPLGTVAQPLLVSARKTP